MPKSSPPAALPCSTARPKSPASRSTISGLDPNSESEEDLAKAEELLTSIKPYIRYFNSSQYIDDLGNGEICVSLGYSGDVFIAADAAKAANAGVEVKYVIPKEGAATLFDFLAIPADAPHPDNAHEVHQLHP